MKVALVLLPLSLDVFCRESAVFIELHAFHINGDLGRPGSIQTNGQVAFVSQFEVRHHHSLALCIFRLNFHSWMFTRAALPTMLPSMHTHVSGETLVHSCSLLVLVALLICVPALIPSYSVSPPLCQAYIRGGPMLPAVNDGDRAPLLPSLQTQQPGWLAFLWGLLVLIVSWIFACCRRKWQVKLFVILKYYINVF